jgi:hypothetical protein
MSDLVHVTTHADDAVAELIGQYQGRPRIEAILRALVRQFQDIEDAAWDVFVQSALDFARDNELDIIGDIVGQKRQGSPDSDYRVFVKARIKTNRSNGRMSTLIAIAKLLLGQSTVVKYREYYPSSIMMSADGVTINSFIAWRDFLHKAKGAAKRIQFIYSTSPASTTLKRGSAYGSFGYTTSQQPGSTYDPGIGGGLTAGIFG